MKFKTKKNKERIIVKEFGCAFIDEQGEEDFIYFVIELECYLTDNGFYYDYGSITNAYHEDICIETEEKDLKECIITKHTAKELECIYAYIDKHSEEMIEQIIKLYNPKEDSPYFDEYDLD